MTRKQLSNSIAGVAIAVALVPPLCVSGIGLTLGSEMVAVFGRGTVAGLTNQIAEGSFLLFGEPDRHQRHQPCGVFAAALRLIPQLLAQSSGLVGIARAVEPALVIGIA